MSAGPKINLGENDELSHKKNSSIYEKEENFLYENHVDRIDKWGIRSFITDIFCKYIIIGIVTGLGVWKFLDLRWIIKFQMSSPHPLPIGAFKAVLISSMSIFSVLIVISAYWFGKNNSFSEYSRQIFKRFEKNRDD